MKMATEQEALDLLAQVGVHYRRVDHPAIWTMDDPNAPQGLPEVKNLLLKDRKSDQFYLYLVDNHRVDFKSLAEQLGLGHSRLKFASEEELESLLGVVSGMVTPLALMHDTDDQVKVLINKSLESMPEISAHPNVNTATILMSYADLVKVLAAMGKVPTMIE
ncbi:YbaK/EbsC family protein [Lentilactobacillus buchneri]|uniref:YbaK/aminoacyl-tRNA synthetase-associated domain-containing protein n=1 Tax=Lentilactobacillus buchneri DSM 20057 TaxID=1423728 RepID=A0A4R5NU44_LENBU|nr:YbaK/EbsC family protein [Lentilactobacillus buchneri]WCJ51317.1 prolyl-tRNA editing protein [Lentilactobacillus sp. Egmn17]AEB72823.1 YbaK/prolyl-tRNA synthetase associated region [Lentilactobacillus buchneri NRRL B-30929]KRK68768.1 YbaK prolyl-tRNA synthetase associated domain-containing protein [Lentilactobacillus buchneri DSM 20057]MCT2899288.1 prolyl-tRNA editing protein [Lentilactobacillus buchneri]MCT3253639.1 prolyl-tRNA editing protein [Lentilactobacillus buchneri]